MDDLFEGSVRICCFLQALVLGPRPILRAVVGVSEYGNPLELVNILNFPAMGLQSEVYFSHDLRH